MVAGGARARSGRLQGNGSRDPGLKGNGNGLDKIAGVVVMCTGIYRIVWMT